MAEGARLESVYTFTGIVGSNPTLSASLYLIDSIALILSMEESVLFPAFSFVFNGLECIHTVVSQFGTVASAGDHRGPANAPFQRRNRLPPPPHSSRRARL